MAHLTIQYIVINFYYFEIECLNLVMYISLSLFFVKYGTYCLKVLIVPKGVFAHIQHRAHKWHTVSVWGVGELMIVIVRNRLRTVIFITCAKAVWQKSGKGGPAGGILVKALEPLTWPTMV